MSKNDSPAGSAGGPVALPDLSDLPEKMRVHALAKLIGVTSREVLAALSGLGHEARSVQSTIERKIVEQVIGALVPGSDDGDADAGATSEEPAPALERAAVLAPVFVPATPLFQAPVRAADDAPSGTPAEAPPSRRRRRGKAEEPAPEPQADTAAEETADEDIDDPAADDAGDAGDEADDGSRRRRRRGRRGRGRGRGGDESDDTDSESESESDTDEESDEDGEEDEPETAEGSRRRRRRRRRRGSGDDAADTSDDDPPGTVTRIRTPRESRRDDNGDGADGGDGVQSVRGSTRLEAKRQRRRDGRDAGRRRQPILSEAEFLARRESVERTMVVRERGSRVEIGVLEDQVLVEHFVTGRERRLAGGQHLPRPGAERAAVDGGRVRRHRPRPQRRALRGRGRLGRRRARRQGPTHRAGALHAATACSCRSPRTRSGTRAPGSPPRSASRAGSWCTCRPAARPASAASCPTSSGGG